MNNVILIGRLVRDPELKFIPSTATSGKHLSLFQFPWLIGLYI